MGASTGGRWFTVGVGMAWGLQFCPATTLYKALDHSVPQFPFLQVTTGSDIIYNKNTAQCLALSSTKKYYVAKVLD